MKLKSLIPLILILAVLVAITVVVKNSKKTPTMLEQTKLEDVVPAGLTVKDIAKLQIFVGAKPDEKVVLERDGEAWKVSSQFNAPAKTDVVENYIDALLKLKGEFRTTATGDEKLGAYNLQDSKAFHVQAFKAGAADPVIDLLAGKAPKFGQLLLRNAGKDRIYLEATNLKQDAGMYGDDTDKAPTADKWLNKEIAKIDKDKVTKIALTMPGKDMVFEKHEKAQPAEEKKEGEQPEGEAKKEEPKKEFEWVLASGGPGGKHKEAGLNTLLQKLTTVTANSVVDPAKKADWGLETPAFKSVISVDGGADVVLEGGHPDPAGNGYVRLASSDKDIVFELTKAVFEQIFPKGSDLFDLPKLTIPRDQISHIEITQPEGKVVVEKEGADWKVVEPAADLKLQKTTLASLASTLTAWKAADYANAGTATGEYNRSVAITTPEGVKTIALAANAKSIDGAYAKLEGSDQVLIMSGADIKKIFLKPRDVFELKLFADLDAEKVTGMDLHDGDTAFTLAKNGEAWSVTANGATAPADKEKVDAFLEGLKQFQVKDIRFGADKAAVQPKTSINLAMSEGQPLQAAISAEQNGVFLMNAANKAEVFEVEKTAVDGLISKLTAAKEAKAGEAPPAAPAPVVPDGESGSGHPLLPPAPAVEMPAAAPAPAEAAPVAVPAPAPGGSSSSSRSGPGPRGSRRESG